MSGQVKHTPGPWRCSGPDEFGDYTIQGPKVALAIAAVTNGRARELCGNGSEHVANARLITAAPELLEELEQSTYKLESAMLLLPKEARQVRLLIEMQIADNRAAIARATGRAA